MSESSESATMSDDSGALGVFEDVSPEKVDGSRPTSDDSSIEVKGQANERFRKQPPEQAKLYVQYLKADHKQQLAQLRRGPEYNETYYEGEIELVEAEALALEVQAPFVEQDMEDMNETPQNAWEHTLQRELWKTFNELHKPPAERMTPGGREAQSRSLQYYGVDHAENTGYCHVLGKPLPLRLTEAAEFVPLWYNSQDLAYLFGTADTALYHPRNTLLLHYVFEDAFADQKITFIPVDTAMTPLELKLVVLDKRLLEPGTLALSEIDGGPLSWKEVNGQRLKFLNDNRPARRYLYFRHCVAQMWALENPDIADNTQMPSGNIWATPGKSTKYLRRATLEALAMKVGEHDLDPALLDAGTFVDTEPGTSSRLQELTTPTRVASAVRGMLGKDKRLVGSNDEEMDERYDGNF